MKYLLIVLSILFCSNLYSKDRCDATTDFCKSGLTYEEWIIQHPENTIDIDNNDYWKPVKKVAPLYPRKANSRGIEGCATVNFLINKWGDVEQTIIEKSIPLSVFDKTSIEAAKQFKFKPTDKNKDRKPMRTRNTFVYFLYSGDSTSKQYDKQAAKCSF